jgi:hypothetical protein
MLEKSRAKLEKRFKNFVVTKIQKIVTTKRKQLQKYS